MNQLTHTHIQHRKSLLQAGEPAPVSVINATASSPFFFTCDHASKRIPARLETLGLSTEELSRHIGWDIGIKAVTEQVAQTLHATMVWQNYSRLVIDCNRALGGEASIPDISEHTVIPGNQNISPADIEQRRQEIFQPYHDRIDGLLDQRAAFGQPTVLVAMHSYTPVFKGSSRHWHMSLMYHRDRRLAALLLDILHAHPEDLIVGDNEPYHVDDATDYGIPVHGEQRGIPHVLIEIRQDLIDHAGGQQAWAERCIDWLRQAEPRLAELGD